ncbi:MAG: hypothetical protein IPN16_19025 [Gemmatimonadetes bacterium]|nr:hypothetical protein [Gemmatimonadota bacterium]
MSKVLKRTSVFLSFFDAPLAAPVSRPLPSGRGRMSASVSSDTRSLFAIRIASLFEKRSA